MEKHHTTTITEITDQLDYGMIYVKEDGTIGEYSEAAKKNLGLVVPKGKSHKAGVIEKGDIVIIADNMLGNDDAVTEEELKLLNISDDDIKSGDMLLAVGSYKDSKYEPVYRHYSEHYPGSELKLSDVYRGYEITVRIDMEKKFMSISVNGEEYQMAYIESIGFMVIVQPRTGEIKFFQDIGYGFRGEEIGKILQGKGYREKNCSEQEENVHIVGAPLKDVVFGDEFLLKVDEIMDSPNGTRQEGTFEIYHRLVLCNFIRIKKGGPNDGVFIIIQEKNNIKKSLEAETAFIGELEKRDKAAQLKLDVNREEHFERFLGSSPQMKVVKHLAYKASKTKFNVILLGESGTGKSRLAREIHTTQKILAPFVEVACNSIAPSLFESELFGYMPGSFTGADRNGRAGFFEEANGGTIFLDEIGELPPAMQAKLLLVLQNKQIYRVGSTKPINIDVRVITATNRDLDEEIRKGNFRQDLYYRINVFPIRIPSLRERKKDLADMASSILAAFCDKYGMEQKHFSNEALKVMTLYDWPGNVRELENVIERAITVCEGKTIYADHLIINKTADREQTLRQQIEHEEARILGNTLIANNGDKQKTMEELGLSRSVFYKKLKKYDLD